MITRVKLNFSRTSYLIIIKNHHPTYDFSNFLSQSNIYYVYHVVSTTKAMPLIINLMNI